MKGFSINQCKGINKILESYLKLDPELKDLDIEGRLAFMDFRTFMMQELSMEAEKLKDSFKEATHFQHISQSILDSFEQELNFKIEKLANEYGFTAQELINYERIADGID